MLMQFFSVIIKFLTSIHWQNLVVPKQLGDVLFILAKNVRVECARRQCENLSLLLERLDDSWVAVALIDC